MKPQAKVVKFVHLRQTALLVSTYVPSLSQILLSVSSSALPLLFVPFLPSVRDIFILLFYFIYFILYYIILFILFYLFNLIYFIYLI